MDPLSRHLSKGLKIRQQSLKIHGIIWNSLLESSQKNWLSCHHLPDSLGFEKAKSLLKEHFGNEMKIATAYTERALSWPAIKSEDVGALQAYVLRGCCNVMGYLQYMEQSLSLSSLVKEFVFCR